MNLGAFAKLGELVLKILAAIGIYRAGKKSAEAKQDKDTLQKIEDIQDARADNRARTDAELRDRLLDDLRRR